MPRGTPIKIVFTDAVDQRLHDAVKQGHDRVAGTTALSADGHAADVHPVRPLLPADADITVTADRRHVGRGGAALPTTAVDLPHPRTGVGDGQSLFGDQSPR